MFLPAYSVFDSFLDFSLIVRVQYLIVDLGLSIVEGVPGTGVVGDGWVPTHVHLLHLFCGNEKGCEGTGLFLNTSFISLHGVEW